MRVRSQKVIQKDVLFKWLVVDMVRLYKPGHTDLIIREERTLKLLKFLALNRAGELLVSLSDSNHSCFGVITTDCIREFERLNHCRITEFSTNTMILVPNVRLKWMNRSRFQAKFGSGFASLSPDCFNYCVLYIDSLELLDLDQDEVGTKLESVYDTPEYNEKVKPFEIPDDEFLCL